MKFGGQVPPAVIGQSQAAMAAWHDFLGQSSRVYRASTGVQGPESGRLLQGQAGSQLRPPAPPAVRAHGGRWISSAVFSHFCL